ncbi:hypothetical protein J2T09_002456 [Neorhizobium huautlense]|uniref:Uncharacterized protein n=1 Tax=Neorhizobium huautlense TaxID=67774 RepID=A0ABT9PVE5_9HYPH|nr:hypothetical protein [Neorhizobium huautlense]MDP9837699.1 hypothetical protein [Neorhizobium huautlense]
MLGVGKVKKIEGTVAQLSQHQLMRDGAYYEFVTIDADDGNSYKIKRVIAGADVNQDLQVGNHLALYVLPFRNFFTAFLKRNVILATETERGVSAGLRLSKQVFAFLGTAFMVGFLSVPYLWLMTTAIASTYAVRREFGGSTDGFGFAWLMGTIPLWPFLHLLVVMAIIMIKANIVKLRLTGGRRTQTLSNGRVLQEL